MAEAITNARLLGKVQAYSAGIEPSRVHPLALETLNRMGIDTLHAYSKHVELFKDRDLDLIITVCDNAQSRCPHWPYKRQVVHFPLDDPAKVQGSKEELLAAFEKTANIIEKELIPVVKRELGIEDG